MRVQTAGAVRVCALELGHSASPGTTGTVAGAESFGRLQHQIHGVLRG